MICHRDVKRLLERCMIIVLLGCACLAFAGTLHAAVHIDQTALDRAISTRDESAYLETLYQTQLDNGIRNFVPLSLLLITASKKKLAEGDSAAALHCAEYALRVAPDLPAATMNQSYVLWKENRLEFHHFIGGLANALVQNFYTLNEMSMFAFTQLAVLGTAIMITLAGLALISLLRNFRLLIHDLNHVLPKALPSYAAVIVLVLLCFFPLLLGFSIAWLFPYWLMLFWTYHNVKERAVIGIFVLLFIFVIPLIAIACSFFLFIPQEESLQKLWHANYGFYTKYDIESFEQDIVQNPNALEIVFSAGLVNKREQNYTTALRYYNRILEDDPFDHLACTNIGNVYFAMGEWEKAVDKYKAAIAAEPLDCEAAYFNLTRAYQQKFMFKDAEATLIEAKKLNSERVEYYLDIYSENYNRLLIDETLPRMFLWVMGFRKFMEQPDLMNTVWGMFFAGLSLPLGTLAVLALLLANLCFGDKGTVRLAAKCTLCGKIMCQRCQRNIDTDILCLQCQNFLKKQEQLSFKQKEAKRVQIQVYVKTFRRWITFFSLVMPGMGHVLKGGFIQGTIFSILYFWLFSQAVFIYFLGGPWSDLVFGKYMTAGLFVFLSAVVWIVLRSHVRKVRSAEIEDNMLLMSLGLDS